MGSSLARSSFGQMFCSDGTLAYVLVLTSVVRKKKNTVLSVQTKEPGSMHRDGDHTHKNFCAPRALPAFIDMQTASRLGQELSTFDLPYACYC